MEGRKSPGEREGGRGGEVKWRKGGGKVRQLGGGLRALLKGHCSATIIFSSKPGEPRCHSNRWNFLSIFLLQIFENSRYYSIRKLQKGLIWLKIVLKKFNFKVIDSNCSSQKVQFQNHWHSLQKRNALTCLKLCSDCSMRSWYLNLSVTSALLTISTIGRSPQPLLA